MDETLQQSFNDFVLRWHLAAQLGSVAASEPCDFGSRKRDDRLKARRPLWFPTFSRCGKPCE